MKRKRENHITNKELELFSNSLRPIVQPVVSELGFTFLDVSLVKEFDSIFLRVTIEHPDRLITLSDCELVSHKLAKELDTKDPIPFHYNLEVQSKGTDTVSETKEIHEFILDKLGLVVKS